MKMTANSTCRTRTLGPIRAIVHRTRVAIAITFM